MPTRKKHKVVVTVEDSGADAIEKVSERCRAAGLRITESLEFLGQIIGEIDADKEASLRRVPGVSSVEPSQEYQLPPPDSDVQ